MTTSISIPISIAELKLIIESLLLYASEPLSIKQLQSILAEINPSAADISQVFAELEQDYQGRAFELKQLASGYRLQIRTTYTQWVSRLDADKPPKYSRALLETLAIIAYRQPVTRAEIEDIRGVGLSSSILKTLLEREWIKISGYRDLPGKPAMYKTTKQFLDYFNLSHLQQLPPLPSLHSIKESALDTEAPTLTQTQTQTQPQDMDHHYV